MEAEEDVKEEGVEYEDVKEENGVEDVKEEKGVKEVKGGWKSLKQKKCVIGIVTEQEVKNAEQKNVQLIRQASVARSNWSGAVGKAKFSIGQQFSKDESWIVEERLKSNYYLDDGVSKWHIIHPVANGTRQSPIDIQTGRAKLEPSLKPIEVNYEKGCVESVVNIGNSFKVNVDDKRASMTGGGLESQYRLVQFHAHWGTTAGAKGSEHTVNGKLYDAELHLVHWNTKYGLLTKAVTESDGLAVIGVFLEVGEVDHPEFEKVIHVFEDIYYKNMKARFTEEIDPAKFLPEDMSYWYYPGSLTTPPLDESVLWHVLRTPISISKRQLDIMASLRTGTEAHDDHSCIINNFRPPVPLFGRRVCLFTGEAVSRRRRAEGHDVEEEEASLRLVKEVSALKDLVSQLKDDLEIVKRQMRPKESSF